MAFTLLWTDEALKTYEKLEAAARSAHAKRTSGKSGKRTKSTKPEGLFKQIAKTVRFLRENPRHPSLHSHEYDSITGMRGERVWEAYAQNKTPAAYRVFWHYGPDRQQITIFAITPHP